MTAPFTLHYEPATFDPATASRAALAEWILNDASQSALREWAWEWLTASYNGDELRRMVRDAMPEDDSPRVDGECEICHNVCDSTTASGMCGNCFERADA